MSRVKKAEGELTDIYRLDICCEVGWGCEEDVIFGQKLNWCEISLSINLSNYIIDGEIDPTIRAVCVHTSGMCHSLHEVSVMRT